MTQPIIFTLILLALILPVLGAIVLRLLGPRLTLGQIYGASALLFVVVNSKRTIEIPSGYKIAVWTFEEVTLIGWHFDSAWCLGKDLFRSLSRTDELSKPKRIVTTFE